MTHIFQAYYCISSLTKRDNIIPTNHFPLIFTSGDLLNNFIFTKQIIVTTYCEREVWVDFCSCNRLFLANIQQNLELQNNQLKKSYVLKRFMKYELGSSQKKTWTDISVKKYTFYYWNQSRSSIYFRMEEESPQHQFELIKSIQ